MRRSESLRALRDTQIRRRAVSLLSVSKNCVRSHDAYGNAHRTVALLSIRARLQVRLDTAPRCRRAHGALAQRRPPHFLRGDELRLPVRILPSVGRAAVVVPRRRGLVLRSAALPWCLAPPARDVLVGLRRRIGLRSGYWSPTCVDFAPVNEGGSRSSRCWPTSRPRHP